MNIVDIINKKKHCKELSYEELDYAFSGYLKKEIKDYQMSALLMAITINGMSFRETCDLTDLFIKSGDVYKFRKKVCDKHSTGGIGDTVTLVIAPIVAALGVPMVKMSGRGLGITGGTADKLESIPGYNINLNKEQYYDFVHKINLAVGSQTDDLVPLDKMIYALRDVTGTTDSIPLIASSIMSKKIACGAKYIVIDVKCGEGALVKNHDEAKELARWLIKIGSKFDCSVKTLITPMDEPLSCCIGNSLEVLEAIEVLKGKECNLKEISVDVAANIISMAKDISINDAKILIDNCIKKGLAYKMFEKWISNQGGDLSKIKVSKNILSIKSNKKGIITNISALACGKLSLKLGCGRINKEDKIDYSVGIKLLKNKGDEVEKGDVLALLYVKDFSIELDANDLNLFTIK